MTLQGLSEKTFDMVASKSEQSESVRDHVYWIITEKQKPRTTSYFECEREHTRRTSTGRERERERAHTFVRIRERRSVKIETEHC